MKLTLVLINGGHHCTARPIMRAWRHRPAPHLPLQSNWGTLVMPPPHVPLYWLRIFSHNNIVEKKSRKKSWQTRHARSSLALVKRGPFWIGRRRNSKFEFWYNLKFREVRYIAVLELCFNKLLYLPAISSLLLYNLLKYLYTKYIFLLFVCIPSVK